MKRKFLCLLLALTLLLGLAATVSAYPDIYDPIYEDDINDTLWDAQPIELGETYSGTPVAYCGDSDLFTFTLEEKTQIRISMVSGIQAVELVLFDSEGKVLTSAEHLGFWPMDYDSVSNNLELFNIFPMELDAGTYYVGIWNTDGTNCGYWFSVKEGVFPCGGYHRAFVHEYIVPSTCQSEGIWTSTCLCGHVTTETAPIFPDAHTFETEIVTPSSCTENGLAIHTCTSCGYIEEETLWAEHTAPGKLVVQEPTMDDYGFYYLTCADCGFVDYEEERHLYPLDHTFIDVEPGKFYEEPVCWAVFKNITSGSTAYHFNPGGQCQRGQIVTFLWRAAGCPVVEAENPFTDVKETDFYYDAVLWAVENGITTGTSADTFSPYKACTRAEVVTFLWRAHGSLVVETTEQYFADVDSDDFFYHAVQWAYAAGITTGIDDANFGPYAICNRAQVVTFLYRAKDFPKYEPSEKYTFELRSNDPTEETGFILCEGTEFAAGESVIFYAEPWYGYLVEFTAEPEAQLELYYLGSYTYELVMPAHDVVLTANFVPAPGEPHYITTTCANGFAFANCDSDEDFNDFAKAGEIVQFYIIPDEGFTFAPEGFSVTANGQSLEDWWYLGEIVEEDPEIGTIDGIFVVELRMPDADISVSITCTPGTAPASAQVRVPVSLN